MLGQRCSRRRTTLLKAREAVGRRIADLDRKVLQLSRNNAQVRRFITVPGVGPITALCFLATMTTPRASRGREVSEPMPD